MLQHRNYFQFPGRPRSGRAGGAAAVPRSGTLTPPLLSTISLWKGATRKLRTGPAAGRNCEPDAVRSATRFRPPRGRAFRRTAGSHSSPDRARAFQAECAPPPLNAPPRDFSRARFRPPSGRALRQAAGAQRGYGVAPPPRGVSSLLELVPFFRKVVDFGELI